MKRLDVLKKEKRIINNLRCLSFDCVDTCNEYYDTEIDAIEKYNGRNPEYSDTENDCVWYTADCERFDCSECALHDGCDELIGRMQDFPSWNTEEDAMKQALITMVKEYFGRR